jgi:signal transduction histidine kinase
MLPTSTSKAWPIAGFVLVALFIAASMFLIGGVRELRSELRRISGNVEHLCEVSEHIEHLAEVVNPSQLAREGEAAGAAFAAVSARVRMLALELGARDPPIDDPENALRRISAGLDRLEHLNADLEDAGTNGAGDRDGVDARRTAIEAYLTTAEGMERGVESLIDAQRTRADEISDQLGRRWTASNVLLLVSCGVVGLTGWLLWRNQQNAARQQEIQGRLNETQNRLGTIVANAPITVWSVDAHGVVTLSEGAALASLDVLPGEQVGRSIFELHANESEMLEAHRLALSGESVDFRTTIGEVAFQALLIPIRSSGGKVVGATGVATDVTARERALDASRRADLQRAEAQKAEALARVAGGVAHEFSNLLTVVSGFAALLKSNPELDQRDRDDVQQILKASGRAAELTQQLLAFSRRQRSEPKVVDLNAIVLEARKMLVTLLGSHVDLRILHSSGPLAVRIDPGQFQQVLLNLGLNARDAMPEGGMFTLALSEVDARDGHGEALLEPGAYACLSVSDSGTGMDEETRSRVFEPFFTTKGPRRGTGLGLPTVQGILRQAGGDVALESSPGRGTTFRLYLPRRDAATIEIDTETKELRLPGGRETILLAEDEPMVRAFTSRVLRRAGYDVLEAIDGKGALEITASFERRIGMLVTDVVMPGIGGRELAKRFLDLRPGTPVLFLSGYAHDEAKLEYVQKPFSPQELCRIVRARLDANEVTQPRGLD